MANKQLRHVNRPLSDEERRRAEVIREGVQRDRAETTLRYL